MSARLAMIVAYDLNRAIGAHGALPWHLPDDLRRFKALTLGHSVRMGRKTYASIGRALPGRRNLVLSRDPEFSAPGIIRVENLEQAVDLASDVEISWVIGGGEIFRLALPLVERLEITEVAARIRDADAWFPDFSPLGFFEVQRTHHSPDSTHAFAFDFVSLVRS